MFQRIKNARVGMLMAGALAIGALFGGSVVSVASPQAAVIYTRTASCGGLNFYIASDSEPFGEDGIMRKANGEVRCNAALPNGANVTKVSFTVYDNTVSGQLSGCALVRTNLVPATTNPNSYDNMTDYMLTDVVPAPGLIRLTDTSISFPTINNARFGYYLQCSITELSNALGLYGATVTYTISSTLG